MQHCLTIVGLGPGSPEQITPQALAALKLQVPVFLRTAVHPLTPSLEAMGVRYDSFDRLYEQCEGLEEVYARIVEQLLGLVGDHPQIVYAVPGHPLVAEATVRGLLAARTVHGFAVEIVPGLSFLDAAYAALAIDPVAGLQTADALRLDSTLNPRIPLLLAQIHSPMIAAEVKLQLLEIYPETHPVLLLSHLGTPAESLGRLPLVDLDRTQPDHLTALYVPALADLPPESFVTTRAVLELVETIRRLRDPEDGCPWDLAQTPRSLCRYIVEEAYETVDAIESDDSAAIEEELGDLLLQIVLQAQIASEADEFGLAEIARGINEKLIRRHPHVFGDVQVRDAEEVNRNWEAIKAQEKQDAPRTLTDTLKRSVRQMNALMATAEIAKKVARVGFEWPNIEGVWAKLEEELAELHTAIEHESPDRQAQELGDVLFTLINVARWQKIDTEAALRETNRRFLARFERVERQAEGNLEKYTIEQLEHFWQQAKRELEA